MGYRPPKGVRPAQLEGKRTGRPRGLRNHARAWADIEWARQHLDEESVKAPNPNALFWWKLAKSYPAQFSQWFKYGGCILTRQDVDDDEDFDEDDEDFDEDDEDFDEDDEDFDEDDEDFDEDDEDFDEDQF